MALRIPWKFTDPDTLDELYLSINPKDDQGSFGIQKNIGYSNMAGTKSLGPGMRDSAALVYAAGTELEVVSYGGNLYQEVQLDDLLTWFSKDYPIEIEDDLGRKNLIMIETFDVSRVRSAKYMWKHSYTFTGIVLEYL